MTLGDKPGGKTPGSRHTREPQPFVEPLAQRHAFPNLITGPSINIPWKRDFKRRNRLLGGARGFEASEAPPGSPSPVSVCHRVSTKDGSMSRKIKTMRVLLIGVRPGRKPQCRVKHMLDALDDDRPRGIVAERHDTLDPQEPCALHSISMNRSRAAGVSGASWRMQKARMRGRAGLTSCFSPSLWLPSP